MRPAPKRFVFIVRFCIAIFNCLTVHLFLLKAFYIDTKHATIPFSGIKMSSLFNNFMHSEYIPPEGNKTLRNC